MTDPLPGFKDQLEARAQQLDARHAARERRSAAASAGSRGRLGSRRLHGRGLAVTILVGAVGVSGVAYAARGLWAPPLGNERMGGTITATASSSPAVQRKAFAILRREPVPLDRGAGARKALTFMDGVAVVRTNDVRRLATGQNGGVVVLVPFERIEVIDFDAVRRAKHPPAVPPMVVQTDRVCLTWVDNFSSAGTVCGNTDDLLAGLSMSQGNPECLVPRQRRDFAKAQRSERRMAAAEGRPPTELVCETEPGHRYDLTEVGLVPDGVAGVRFGAAGPVFAVRDNVWQGHRPAGDAPMVWLDSRGRELSTRVADTRKRLGLPRG